MKIYLEFVLTQVSGFRTHSCNTIEMSQWWSGEKNFCYLFNKSWAAGVTIIWGEADPMTCITMLVWWDYALWPGQGVLVSKVLFQERYSLMCRSFLPPADTVPSKPVLFKKKYTVHNPNLKLLHTECGQYVFGNKHFLKTFSKNLQPLVWPLNTCMVILKQTSYWHKKRFYIP